MTARRVVISGRVHGVGFRGWLVEQAEALGISGWVRNRRDGTIEVLMDGAEPAIEELLRACRRGPRYAEVASIDEHLADPPDQPGFLRLPTA